MCFKGTRPNILQKECLKELTDRIGVILAHDCCINYGVAEIKRDLDGKDVSYTGEEVARMQKLSVRRMLPALPPQGHGGSISAVDWVSSSTRSLLENPEASLIEDDGRELPCLQGKVHIEKGEELAVAQTLVSRNVCVWIDDDDVMTFRQQKVYNGLFGVEKATTIESGETTLRCIMNLVPSNSLFKILEGGVRRLPHITQWLSVYIGEEEELEMHQSDITAAFYLFQLPSCWRRCLAFNIRVRGSELGPNYTPDKLYTLASNVLPMGWSSAVGVMQELSERILHTGGLSSAQQILKTKSLPAYITDAVKKGDSQKRAWWHFYLDNFASAERVPVGEFGSEAQRLHNEAEEIWKEAGILSSEKKRVDAAKNIIELGAMIEGQHRWIGGAPERLLRVAKLSFWVCNKKRVSIKLLQIIMGRWVHLLQYRRPAMGHFEGAWELLRGWNRQSLLKARVELLGMCLGVMLLHTNLGAAYNRVVSCSDASGTGGAVAFSEGLTAAGKEYVAYEDNTENHGATIPVLAISLFDGIGGCMRSYNLAGCKPRGYVAVEIHKPAIRVVQRRWPWVTCFGDVRAIDTKCIQDWLQQTGEVDEIHLWGGFPCKDVSGAKTCRSNLHGEHSGLFYHLLRVRQLCVQLLGTHRVRLFAENVCSMDTTVRDEISHELGMEPYRVDADHMVPLARPRFLWTDIRISEGFGVVLEKKVGYTQVWIESAWPWPEQWVEEQWEAMEADVTYPTCMRSIPREVPPPKPVGFARCQQHELARWREDSFRFPPYHYKDCYMFAHKETRRMRYMSASEREILMGYGAAHTEPAMSASNAKQAKQGYEDERLSLIGDSFPANVFSVIVASAVQRWVPRQHAQHYMRRLGLAPGACTHVTYEAPMTRRLTFGSVATQERTDKEEEARAVSLFGSKVNHTGSDVRVCTGEITNPRLFPRQAIWAALWKWRLMFQTRWKSPEHINQLELRAILLSLESRLRHHVFVGQRCLHLSDSFVCVSVISKGRSSSKGLQLVLRKIGSLTLTAGAYLLCGHVDSMENPTDEASRQ